ncbi:MAG: transporter substrate-binding domain-containing protein [Puniceicoccaceae bacterium]
MKIPSPQFIIKCLLVAGSACWAAFACGQSMADEKRGLLTAEELAWLEDHPVLQFHLNLDAAPYSYLAENGQAAGIMADLLKLAEDWLGIEIEHSIHLSFDLDNILKQGDATVAGIWTKEAIFQIVPYQPTRSFVKGYFALYGKSTEPLIIDPDQVTGKRIAMIHRIGTEETNQFLSRNERVWVTTPDELFSALISGKADYILGFKETTRFHMRQTLVTDFRELYTFPESQDGILLVHNDEPELLSIFNKFLTDIESEELPAILSKWYGHLVKPTLALTDQERAWLNDHPTIRVGLPTELSPLSFTEPITGSQGIFVDYLKLVAERANLDLEIEHHIWADVIEKAKQRDLDVFPAIQTQERSSYMAFSKEFFVIPGVIITDNSVSQIWGPFWLSDKRISVVENTNWHEYVSNRFPYAQIVPFKDVDNAVFSLVKGEVDAFVGERFGASRVIAQNHLEGLKIAGPAGASDELLRFAVRKDWPELVGILDKAVDTISQREHDEILHKWSTVRYEHQVDYRFFLRILAGILLIIVALFLWNRQLRHSVAKHTIQLAKANQGLGESEAKYRALVERTSDVVHSVNAEGILTYLSPQAIRYGIDPQKVVGSSFFDLIAPEDREKVAADLQKSISTGKEFPTEFRIIDDKGIHHWFEERGSILRDDSGEILGTSGVLRDITDRKREVFLWEAQLRLIEKAEASTFHQFLRQVAGEARIITGSEVGFYHFVVGDGTELSLQACSTGEKVDPTMEEIGGCCSNGISQALSECLRKKTPLIYNDFPEFLRKKGSTGHSQFPGSRLLIAPVVRLGNSVAILGIGDKKSPYDENDLDMVQRLGELAWEIVERKQAHGALKQSEEELRQAQQIAKVGSYSWNLTGGPSNWSRETSRILNCGEAEPSHDLFVSLIHPDDRDKVIERANQASKDRNQFELEYRILCQDGTIRWVHDIATVVSMDGGGTPDAIFGTLQDITERKEAELNLQKSLKELKRWHDLTIGREERIQHLKEEVNELLTRLGEESRYQGKVSK